jgi:hypothetical protein
MIRPLPNTSSADSFFRLGIIEPRLAAGLDLQRRVRDSFEFVATTLPAHSVFFPLSSVQLIPLYRSRRHILSASRRRSSRLCTTAPVSHHPALPHLHARIYLVSSHPRALSSFIHMYMSVPSGASVLCLTLLPVPCISFHAPLHHLYPSLPSAHFVPAASTRGPVPRRCIFPRAYLHTF